MSQNPFERATASVASNWRIKFALLAVADLRVHGTERHERHVR